LKCKGFFEALFHSNRTVGFKGPVIAGIPTPWSTKEFPTVRAPLSTAAPGRILPPSSCQPGGEASALQRLKRVQGLGLDIEVLYPRMKAHCHSNPHLLTPRPSHALRVLPLTHIRYSVETKPRIGYLFCVPYSPLFYLSSWSSLSHNQMPKVVCLYNVPTNTL